MSTIICANTHKHKEKTVEQDIAVQSYFRFLDLTTMLGMRSLNMECWRYI